MPWISNVHVWGEAKPRDFEIRSDTASAAPIDGTGMVLVPSFVDLGCDPGFPGFPQRETPQSLGDAALAGGYSDLVTRPCVDPIPDQPEHLADLRRRLPGGARVWPTPALTRGQAGLALTEFGLLSRFSIPGVSDGGVIVADTLILRNAMEYAHRFTLRLWLRPGDPALDGLGVVHDSPFATVLGLRGNPATNEEIGLSRIFSLVRASGAAVVVGPLGTRAGVALLRSARAEGLPITGYVAARSLLLDEHIVEGAPPLARMPYDTRVRLHPPLRAQEDRRALVQGVREKLLLVSADHEPRAPEEKELEFELAIPGSTGLESAFAATLTALSGDLEATIHALAIGPRALLPETVSGWTLIDPESETTVNAALHLSLARNDALDGLKLRGKVIACFPGERQSRVTESK